MKNEGKGARQGHHLELYGQLFLHSLHIQYTIHANTGVDPDPDPLQEYLIRIRVAKKIPLLKVTGH